MWLQNICRWRSYVRVVSRGFINLAEDQPRDSAVFSNRPSSKTVLVRRKCDLIANYNVTYTVKTERIYTQYRELPIPFMEDLFASNIIDIKRCRWPGSMSDNWWSKEMGCMARAHLEEPWKSGTTYIPSTLLWLTDWFTNWMTVFLCYALCVFWNTWLMHASTIHTHCYTVQSQ